MDSAKVTLVNENLTNAQPLCRFVEFLSIDAIAVTQQIAGLAVPREIFRQLPGRPFRRGIRGHSKMNWASAVMGENNRDKRKLECDRRNNEEIGRPCSAFGSSRRYAMFGMAAFGAELCTSRRSLARLKYQASSIARESPEHPNAGWPDSFSE
jgi:hypothetical protein